MTRELLAFGPAILEIIGINILLSGDNAIVIALACRALPGGQRRLGVALGAGVAVLLRIVFTLIITALLGIPWLRVAGGVLLIWIAVNLLQPEEGDADGIAAHASLWRAVWTVAVADVVMSFDNVLAIAAAAHGSLFLIILGLILSVPLVVVGATLILRLIEWMPLLVWAGAALLGWIAGELMLADIGLAPLAPHWLDPRAVAVGAALLVVVLGYALRRSKGITGWQM